MIEILLPCPFCGGEAKLQEYDDASGGIYCSKCNFEPLVYASFWGKKRKQEAVAEWNRRPDQWIPVSERLPEDGLTFFGWHKAGVLIMTVNVFDEMDDVTHWMPMPSPPKGVELDG